MNVIFLTIGKFDNINERGIYSDLLRKFINEGHDVSVVCQSERRDGLATSIQSDENIEILRVKTGNITKVGFIEKGISTILIEYQYLFALKRKLSEKKFDLILYSTPPITFSRIIKYLKKRDGAYAYLMLKDIFPQNAIDLQLFKYNGLIHRYFRNKEHKLYQISDSIGCMSNENINYIRTNYPMINENKIELCPNTIDISNTSNITKLLKRKTLELPIEKCIFLYGGNLGRPQGIDFLLQCIKRNEDNENSHFLVVGSGTEYPKIRNFINENKICNTTLIHYITKTEFDNILKLCDVGLVFLDNRFTIPNYPSRILTYMENSLPILAATDKVTDIRQLIEENDLGYWCESVNVNRFNDFVIKLSESEIDRKNKGANSYKYLINNFTVNKSYKAIIKHFI